MMTKGIFDAACRGFDTYSDVTWFFKGNQYIRYLMGTDTVDLSPSALHDVASGWAQQGTIRWPSAWTKVDAALNGSDTYAGKVWFFSGANYLRYVLGTDTIELDAQPIAANWAQNGATRWPWPDGIDCAIHGIGTYAGKAWFFRGSQYFRLDIEGDTIDVAPQPIATNWGQGKWPPSFATGVDCAFYGTGDLANQIYFFRGDQYIRYNPETDTIERGPLPVKDHWGTTGASPAISLYEQLYNTTPIWGVDSVTAASFPPPGTPAGAPGKYSLYDRIAHELGVQPHFWGRYLGMLTRPEIDYLAARHVKLLLIKNGLDNIYTHGMADGLGAAKAAADKARSLGAPAGVAIFGDIEPGWVPSREFILGWMLGLNATEYVDGLYAFASTNAPYAAAFAVRAQIDAATTGGTALGAAVTAALTAINVPAATISAIPSFGALTALRDTYLWAGLPFISKCPTGLEAMRTPFGPQLMTTNSDHTVVWQCKTNCMTLGGSQGYIDHDLVTDVGYGLLWDPGPYDNT